jgi:3-deoxy-D-manno-octulosonic-acid transferase
VGLFYAPWLYHNGDLMMSALILYNTVLAVGLFWGWPFWLLYLMLVPKTWQPLPAKLQRLGWFDEVTWAQLGHLSTVGKSVIWLHAVSVGEVNAIRDLALTLHRQGRYSIAVSTTTATGQALARQVLPPEVPVFYCPLDFWWINARVIRRIQPDLLLLTETELWPNLIFYATQWAKRPVLLINGRLSPRSYRGYRWLRTALMRPLLQAMTGCYMQSQGDAERMTALGAPPDQMHVMGNLKFDITPTVAPEQVENFRQLFQLRPGDSLMVGASTHGGEEALLVESYLQLKKDFPQMKLVLAPRHPERVDSVRKLLNVRALRHSCRSELGVGGSSAVAQDIIILDTIGELLAVFALAQVVVMGGSFVPTGGHNLLEPLAMRVPVIFGPHMFNFPDISRWVLDYRAGEQVADGPALVQAVRNWMTQPDRRDDAIEQGQRLLMAHRGAKDRLIQVIDQTLAPHTNPL